MKKNSLIKILFFISILNLTFTSCDKGGGNTQSPNTSGVHILSSGNFGDNNSSLSIYDIEDKTLSAYVFETVNGIKIGDTANDMLIYGDNIYIGATGSEVVLITDLSGKLITKLENIAARKFVGYDGKVYVTDFAGKLVQIDTKDHSTKSVAVGNMPEGVIAHDGLIYVANSDGMNYTTATVSVVDPATMTVTKTITVGTNPQTFFIDQDNELYLITWGNYAEIPAKLQKIDTTNGEVSTIEGVIPTRAAMGTDGELLIISSVYDENWNMTTKYLIFDTVSDKVTGNFIQNSTDIKNNPSGVKVDTKSGNIYVLDTDYVNTGNMYIFNSQGALLESLDCQGLNPICVEFTY